MKTPIAWRAVSLGAMFALALGGGSGCRSDNPEGPSAESQDPSAGLASTGEPANDQQVELAITGMT